MGIKIDKFNQLNLSWRKKNSNPNMYCRVKYGFYKGHYAWDLACKWFKTDNDTFFKIYGFNFVPSGTLFHEAKEFVHNSQ